jgi:hypothetical protein
MSATDLLIRGRAKAEAQMVDECTIDRPGEPVTDAETGKVTVESSLVYEGKCKVQSKDSAVASPEAGGHSFVVVSRQVHIPMNEADVQDKDVITMTASLLNSFTVGKKYVVRGFTPDSYDTAARMPVKEITS